MQEQGDEKCLFIEPSSLNTTLKKQCKESMTQHFFLSNTTSKVTTTKKSITEVIFLSLFLN